MGGASYHFVELSGGRGELVVFTDEDGVEVARRVASIQVNRIHDARGVLQQRPKGQLAGGRWSALDIAGRRLLCRSRAIGPDPLPCVVRTSGEIVFLPR